MVLARTDMPGVYVPQLEKDDLIEAEAVCVGGALRDAVRVAVAVRVGNACTIAAARGAT